MIRTVLHATRLACLGALATLALGVAGARSQSAGFDPNRPYQGDAPVWRGAQPPTGEETRESLLAILDDSEWFFRHLPLEKSVLQQIEAAREQTLQVPAENMEIFAQQVGPQILQLRGIMAEQRAQIRAELRRRQILANENGALAKSAGFPTLRTDVPEYKEGSASASVDYDDDTGDAPDDDDSWTLSSLCDITPPSSPDNRISRQSMSAVLGFRIGLAVAQAIQMIADRICTETVLANCAVCCIPTDIVYLIVEIAYDSFMLCQDGIDSSELEAAYHNTRTIHSGVTHLHGDVDTVKSNVNTVLLGVDAANSKLTVIDGKIETIDDKADIIIDATACHPVTALVRGSGCNGNDDDCDDEVDEADEDAFAPLVHIDEAVAASWYATPAEALAAVARAVHVTDECRTFTVGAPTLTGSCGAITASVQVTDAVGNVATATTIVRVDASAPGVTLPPSMTGTCHVSVAAAEAAVRAAAVISDDCTPAGALVVRTESAVSECSLRVRVDVTDLAGKTSSAATTVHVDDSVPRVEIERLLLGFRGEVLATQAPPCFASVAEAEAAVLAVTRLSDGCTASAGLAPSVSSSGSPCSLRVTVSTTDGCGGSASDSVVVRVDDAAPAVSSSTRVSELRPGNHELVDVGFTWTATDACPGTIVSDVTVTSDEATSEADGAGQTSKAPDAVILRDPDGTVRNVLLRAERSSSGDGRVYAIRVKTTDPCGHVSTSTSTVRVPRNPGSSATDSGQYYDATRHD